MERLSKLVCLVLYSKLSSCPWAHMSGHTGLTDRSVGLLIGRARLSGTAKTLVGGDPCLSLIYLFYLLYRKEKNYFPPRLGLGSLCSASGKVRKFFIL
jgi:hypothetical protein